MLVRLTVNFHVVAQLAIVVRLEQTRYAAVWNQVTCITQFPVVAQFQTEAPSVKRGVAVNVSTLLILAEVRVAQFTVKMLFVK